MRFCDICNNMLYLKVNDEKLSYYCKNCNFCVIDDSASSKCVMRTTLDEDVSSFKQYMTPYIKYDRTLPRVDNIECPNNDCKTKTSKLDNMVIYIKYNQSSMSFLYYCCHCEKFWK